MSQNRKNDGRRNRSCNKFFDFTTSERSISIPAINRQVPDVEKRFGPVKNKRTKEPPLSTLGFNWQEYNYLQNVLTTGECQLDHEIECASITISTSTTSKEEESQPESISKLQYLMGLPANLEGESSRTVSETQEIAKPSEKLQETLAMKRARIYLESHKISEFFQFLIAHLVAIKSDKPVDFLIELLDKCLIYRTGLCEPPLLYTQQHLEQLFHLMDRLKTNYIDYDQYKTGMLTLGIVNYCKRPVLSAKNLISKAFFMAEVLKALTAQLDGMIEKRTDSNSRIVSNVTPPPSTATMKSNNLREG